MQIVQVDLVFHYVEPELVIFPVSPSCVHVVCTTLLGILLPVETASSSIS